MTGKGRLPVRFSLLTVSVWLLVAAGVIAFLWQVITRISASYMPISTATPNLTQVYQTISAMLTVEQTQPFTTPSYTITPDPAGMQTPSPTKTQAYLNRTATSGAATPTNTATVPCNRASAGTPLDVTIPDDSQINPGQSFIKTWKLINSGICTWTTEYSAHFFYGDRMGAPEVVSLKQIVLPQQSIELSIEMIAPLAAGTYQGNWKLSNSSGALFGIGPNGDSPFWVRILVSANPTATPSATQASTPTINPSETANPSSTPTPAVAARGELSVNPGDSIDLDTLKLNMGEGDLEYRMDEHQYHWLSPTEEAMIGVFGNHEPSLNNCSLANMSPAPIAAESLSIGTYLCYTTHEKRLGWALLKSVEGEHFTLTLDLLTWQKLP